MFHPSTTSFLHTTKKLRQQQLEMRSQIQLQKLPQPIRYIAGCDSALIGDDIFSVFVILSYPDLKEIEVQTNRSALPLPYIPGLLSFREIPNLLVAYEKITQKPDLIMVDGHGIAHPRRMGIATHLGIELHVPTIGVAKKRLFGTYAPPGRQKGDSTFLMHKSEVLGAVLRSKDNVKEIFVSPGNYCDLDTAFTVVLHCLRGYRLPEPTRLADKYSKSLKPQNVYDSHMLPVGSPAPEFSLPDQNGEVHTLAEFKGKWLVLYFYPKDDTPGCTVEACSFRDSLSDLRKKKIQVIGISKDTVKSHAKFAEKYDLPFPILSDPEHTVIESYGAWGKKKFMGREYDGILRTTFLIDPQGKIGKIYENVKPEGHTEMILKDIEALQSA